MALTRIPTDVYVAGNLNATSMTFPAGSVGNADIEAATGISASKQQHCFRKVYSQESDTTASDLTRVIHVVTGTSGTLVAVEAGAVVASGGTDVVDVDLLVNGTTCLSAVIRVDNGDAAYAKVAGTVGTAALSAGDVLEIDINATAGDTSLPKGVFCSVSWLEDYA